MITAISHLTPRSEMLKLSKIETYPKYFQITGNFVLKLEFLNTLEFFVKKTDIFVIFRENLNRCSGYFGES